MSALFVLGNSQRILLPTPRVLMAATSSAIMAWIRPDSIEASSMGILSYAIGPPPAVNSSPRISLQINASGQIFVQARSTDGDTTRTFTGIGVVSVGVWTHVAVTIHYGTSYGRTFINGELDNQGQFSANFAAATVSNTVSKSGAISGNGYGDAPQFNGLIEDARIYRRNLGPAEMQTIFSARGTDGIHSGLESRYQLLEHADGLALVVAPNIGTTGPSGNPVNGVVYGPTYVRTFRRNTLSVR